MVRFLRPVICGPQRLCGNRPSSQPRASPGRPSPESAGRHCHICLRAPRRSRGRRGRAAEPGRSPGREEPQRGGSHTPQGRERLTLRTKLSCRGAGGRKRGHVCDVCSEFASARHSRLGAAGMTRAPESSIHRHTQRRPTPSSASAGVTAIPPAARAARRRRRGPLSSSHRHHPLARYARARAAGPRRSGSRDRREARLRESGREAGRSPRPAHPAVVETDRTSARATRGRTSVEPDRSVDAPRHICIARAVSLSRISRTTAMGSTPNRAASATT